MNGMLKPHLFFLPFFDFNIGVVNGAVSKYALIA